MIGLITVIAYGLVLLALVSSILGLAAALVQQILILGIVLLIGVYTAKWIKHDE